jgi:hypothetical protein
MSLFIEQICAKCHLPFEIVDKFAKDEKLCANCKGWLNKDDPTEIVIKPELIDISKVQAETIQNLLWRPTEFTQYIGQNL